MQRFSVHWKAEQRQLSLTCDIKHKQVKQKQKPMSWISAKMV